MTGPQLALTAHRTAHLARVDHGSRRSERVLLERSELCCRSGECFYAVVVGVLARSPTDCGDILRLGDRGDARVFSSEQLGGGVSSAGGVREQQPEMFATD
jgi:hypothetical protein